MASMASRHSYIFKDAISLEGGLFRIQANPYCNRDGCRLHAFFNEQDIEKYLSPSFEHFSFGLADNNLYSVCEHVFWVVCRNNQDS